MVWVNVLDGDLVVWDLIKIFMFFVFVIFDGVFVCDLYWLEVCVIFSGFVWEFCWVVNLF